MHKLYDHILQTLQLVAVMMEPSSSLSDAVTAGTRLTDDNIHSCLSGIRRLVSEAVYLLTYKQYRVESILLTDETGDTNIEFEELISRLHCESLSCDNEPNVNVVNDQQSLAAFLPPSTININNQLAVVAVKRKRGRPKKATKTQASESTQSAVSGNYQETDSFQVPGKLQSENIRSSTGNLRHRCRGTSAGTKYTQQNNDKNFDTEMRQTLKTGDNYLSKIELKQPLCLMCNEVFETLSECLEHWQTSHIINEPHSGKLSVNCSHCPPSQNCLTVSSPEDDLDLDITLAMSLWLLHALSVHGFTPPHDVLTEFSCSFPCCRFQTYFEAELELHSLHGPHQVGRARRNALSVCDRCGQMVKHGILLTHRKRCLQFSQNSLVCPHCATCCATKQMQRRHIRESHPDVDVKLTKDYQCSCCNYATDKRSSFIEHMYRRHGLNDARSVVFACGRCKFSTVKRSALIRHETRTHSDARTLVCTHCSKAFKCLASLQAHMLVHNDYDDRRFPCSLCGYRAARKAHLLAHQDAQHGASAQLYSCELCGYCNGYAANVNRHRRLFCKFRDKSTSAGGGINSVVVPTSGDGGNNVVVPTSSSNVTASDS